MNAEQENQLAGLAGGEKISILEGDRYTSATHWYTGILEDVNVKDRNVNLRITRAAGYVPRTNINQDFWKPSLVVETRTIPFDDIRAWNVGEPAPPRSDVQEQAVVNTPKIVALQPHPEDPSMFYVQYADTPDLVLGVCPAGLIFNPELGVCDWPFNVSSDVSSGGTAS